MNAPLLDNMHLLHCDLPRELLMLLLQCDTYVQIRNIHSLQVKSTAQTHGLTRARTPQ